MRNLIYFASILLRFESVNYEDMASRNSQRQISDESQSWASSIGKFRHPHERLLHNLMSLPSGSGSLMVNAAMLLWLAPFFTAATSSFVIMRYVLR